MVTAARRRAEELKVEASEYIENTQIVKEVDNTYCVDVNPRPNFREKPFGQDGVELYCFLGEGHTFGRTAWEKLENVESMLDIIRRVVGCLQRHQNSPMDCASDHDLFHDDNDHPGEIPSVAELVAKIEEAKREYLKNGGKIRGDKGVIELLEKYHQIRETAEIARVTKI